MSLEKDRIFFRNYSIVIGLLLVTIMIFLLAAVNLGTNEAVITERQSGDVSKRTAPVGQINTPRAQAAAAETVPAEGPMAAATGSAAQSGGSPPPAPASQQQTAAAGEQDSPAEGQQVYRGICASCHNTGLPGVPQLGDVGAWQQRVEAKGMDTLYNNAITGFMGEGGMPMPAKGGNPSLTDAEVRAAVDYMVSSSQ